MLTRLAETHRFIRYRQIPDTTVPFVLLRHDVEYLPSAALRMAEDEAARGISGTYFLLLNTRYYNLLAPEHASFAQRLATLGHDIGLHYDVNFFTAFPREQWDRLLKLQVKLLSEISGTEVRAIAMHQPALNGADPFAHTSELINASSVRDVTYISDSCRAWRDSAWTMFASRNFPPRLQLALHPINWAERDRDRETIFRTLHQDLARDIVREGDELLKKIAAHSGVAEHNARGVTEEV